MNNTFTVKLELDAKGFDEEIKKLYDCILLREEIRLLRRKFDLLSRVSGISEECVDKAIEKTDNEMSDIFGRLI